MSEYEDKRRKDLENALNNLVPVIQQQLPEAALRESDRSWTYSLVFDTPWDVVVKVDDRGGSKSWVRWDWESLQISISAPWRTQERDKVFPQKKDGSFSWDKIKEHIGYLKEKSERKAKAEEEARTNQKANDENLESLYPLPKRLQHTIVGVYGRKDCFNLKVNLNFQELKKVVELFHQMEKEKC